MNDEIEIMEAKTLEVKEEIKSFQGNLVIKSQKIAEQELQLKWFAEKQKIFAQQKGDMMKTKMELQSRLVRNYSFSLGILPVLYVVGKFF